MDSTSDSTDLAIGPYVVNLDELAANTYSVDKLRYTSCNTQKQIEVSVCARGDYVRVIGWLGADEEGWDWMGAECRAETKKEEGNQALHLTVRTQYEYDGSRIVDDFPHAGPFIDAAIAFFDKQTYLRQFEAYWQPRFGATNYDQFNNAIRQGDRWQEAVFKTWTGGRVAARHDFVHATHIDTGKDDKGNDYVRVMFSRCAYSPKLIAGNTTFVCAMCESESHGHIQTQLNADPAD